MTVGPQAGETFSDSESAGPFNDNDIITTGNAVLSGILVLLGFLAFAGAAALLGYGLLTRKSDVLTQAAPFVALAGAFLIVLAVVLAIFLYPSEIKDAGFDLGFWGSQSADDFTISTYAAWGWYTTIVAAVLGATGAVFALREGAAATESAPSMTTNQPQT